MGPERRKRRGEEELGLVKSRTHAFSLYDGIMAKRKESFLKKINLFILIGG